MMAALRAGLLLFAFPLVAGAQVTAITGGTVHTMGPEGVLLNATVLIEGTRITAVGRGLTVPAGAEVFDASGQVVTPGIFAPLTQLGLTEVKSVADTVDHRRSGQQFAASFNAIDAYNPASTLVPVARMGGVTTAVLAPSASGTTPDDASGLFAGIAAVVGLGSAVDFLYRRDAAMFVHLGSSGGNRAGGSRALAVMKLRAALDDAIDFRRHRRSVHRGGHADWSLSAADLEALGPVLDGRLPLALRVDRASDIRVALGLRGDYPGLRLVIVGGAEAWQLAEELAAAKVPVILDATENLPTGFDSLAPRLDAAALLTAAGVTVTFGGSSRRQAHNVRNLLQAAGVAAANGLDRELALRAVTAVPAEIFGLAERHGRIAAGMAANVAIWSGDPLEPRSFAVQTYIDGKAVAMVSRQSLLRDRYLPGQAERLPAYRR